VNIAPIVDQHARVINALTAALNKLAGADVVKEAFEEQARAAQAAFYARSLAELQADTHLITGGPLESGSVWFGPSPHCGPSTPEMVGKGPGDTITVDGVEVTLVATFAPAPVAAPANPPGDVRAIRTARRKRHGRR
jgi:hypothetical protein